MLNSEKQSPCQGQELRRRIFAQSMHHWQNPQLYNPQNEFFVPETLRGPFIDSLLVPDICLAPISDHQKQGDGVEHWNSFHKDLAGGQDWPGNPQQATG
ncbi:hypothetical protein GCM10009077_15920 [Roseibium denhamense]